MKVRKYTARTSRDALRQVREDLGPDAVILANRMVRGGVEIMAMPAAEMAAQTAASAARQTARLAAAAPLEVTEDDVVITAGDRPLTHDARRRTWPPQELEVREQPVAGRQSRPAGADEAELGADLSARSLALLNRMAAQAPTPAAVFPPAAVPVAVPAAALAPALAAESAPAPAPPPRLGLRPTPTAGAPSPAVLRRRSPRPAAPAAPAEQRIVAREEAGPDAARLDALALRHDPLMAALAEEVKSLGSMLGQPPRAEPPSPQPNLAPSRHGDPLPQAVEAVEQARGGDAWMRNMMGELRSMRTLIEDQMGALAFTDAGRMQPGKARMVRILSAAGFSVPLIRKLTARMPETIAEADALAFVCQALASNLAVAGSEAELLDQGGVFALVGPTGAGKTTTAAKLAARFVVRHGAENLALLTTDGYRIGGQEQLRIYGRILGVAVHAVKDAEDLRRTLGELRERKLVLIDTVGLSQRDRLVAEQHELFAHCGATVKRLLLLNGTCHGDTLNDVVRAYRGDGLAGCILTKLDEAAALGAALDTAIRQRLRVFYAADGQRVPEDLHLAESARLVERALEGVSASESLSAAEGDFPFELPPVQLLNGLRSNGSGVIHG